MNASDAATELAAWLRSRFKPAKRPQAALWAAGTEQDGPDRGILVNSRGYPRSDIQRMYIQAWLDGEMPKQFM